MTRRKAATIHFLSSVACAMAVTALIVLVWYPPPLLAAAGGKALLLLLIGIDACLGPLCTFIIFNPTKSRRELTLDLSVIVLVQLAALAYGLYASALGRPVYIVFGNDRFMAIPAVEFEADALRKAPPEFRNLPLTGPRWIGAKRPEDKRASDVVWIHPEYYVPLEAVKPAMLKNAGALEKLKKHHPKDTTIDAALKRRNLTGDRVGYLPLDVKGQSLSVLIDRQTAEILAILPLDPWPSSKDGQPAIEARSI